MPLNFPNSPQLDQVYTEGNRTWRWNGRYWEATSSVEPGNNLTVALTNSSNQDIESYSGTVRLNFDSQSGFTLADLGDGVIKIVSTGGSGGGGGSGFFSGTIKTFNILNEFTAPYLGTAVFVPTQQDTIRSLQLNNSGRVTTDLTVGLYRNNDLLGFFTIPQGEFYQNYSQLNFLININDYLTVNVVSGSGSNFTMTLFNI